jgi:hypothetical protein
MRNVFLAWILFAAALLGLGTLYQATESTSPADAVQSVRAQAP